MRMLREIVPINGQPIRNQFHIQDGNIPYSVSTSAKKLLSTPPFSAISD
jgi:hypothetical protein